MEKLVPFMMPAAGDRLVRYVGDCVSFSLSDGRGRPPTPEWQARLRTNLGRGELLRQEILEAHTHGLPLAGASWRDIPMPRQETAWKLNLPLTEVGFFKAKPYLLDPQGWQHWPSGADVGICVHPDAYRTSNTLYCAFARLFGSGVRDEANLEPARQASLKQLDGEAYTVIPPSGKLRDLERELPHIFRTLGCKILHLLPVSPTPTTYARFGRFGSPYAALDLTAIDPALVVFDKRATGEDQFRELTYAVHLHGGRVFLDIVINHTGWGSVLQETHPEWFLKDSGGTFVSPGAWGNTWEDLVELKHENVRLWDQLADAFLVWCRRGVDGFRCDAGYKVPMPAWQYIIARVQQEYADTVFLLEGLGGAWETTEALLTEGGMQWAYSELFQNYTGPQVGTYLDHGLRQSERVGLLVHYSETHDNERLAARGRAWSLLRNRLCALASVSGGFGFTSGVEWLSTEKIRVHGRTSLSWGSSENIVPELGKLDQLLASHPCFFDGARLTRLSPLDSAVFALGRTSQEGLDSVLVLVNADLEKPVTLSLDPKLLAAALASGPQSSSAPALNAWIDLLGQPAPNVQTDSKGKLQVQLPAAAAYCLAPSDKIRGLHGDAYRRARQQAAWAIKALSQKFTTEHLGNFDWRPLAAAVENSPASFLARLASFPPVTTEINWASICGGSTPAEPFPKVVRWTLLDVRRVTPVPADHWLLVEDDVPFRASLSDGAGSRNLNVESIAAGKGQVVCFPPGSEPVTSILRLERYAESDRQVEAEIRFLGEPSPSALPRETDLVLLTNGRGGMARLCVDLGRVNSKYDCVLGANLHPSLPVDRHIFIKRIRAWVTADGFISPLDFRSLRQFVPGPPAVWSFVANAGDGRTVEIQLQAGMVEGKNTVRLQFVRPSAEQATGKQLPSDADVRLTVRLDLEDRNFHWETKRNSGADYHFSANTHSVPAAKGSALPNAAGQLRSMGFKFTPAADRQLLVVASEGSYHPQPEWSENIAHPVEQSRGQTGSGDGYSPGWFELPLPKGATVQLIASAELNDFSSWEQSPGTHKAMPLQIRATDRRKEAFGERLGRAINAFVVKRGEGKTVIAGYPWFLDWGRDTFISARGLLAAGLKEEVKQVALIFARFEHQGTLPNTIFGEDASNRDTSDAPLWFGLVCEELAGVSGPVQSWKVTPERSLLDVLCSIARHYISGTPNGIRMDPGSGLIWSPAHFTWMDTNYPASTAREGYPVEIQALWIRLLRYLARIDRAPERGKWSALAEKAAAAVEQYFWLPQQGYYADVLTAPPGQAASQATPEDALRSNCLFLISLGLVTGEKARSCAAAALRYLVVPGALRSLAPLRVSKPLPVIGNNGQLLNDPFAPYWGRYEGDEDTRRKPAYHNGTAWTWTFPVFCEALAAAWNFSPDAVAAARAYLGSMEQLMDEGCLEQIPEILDGDKPHWPRGCDAQAWGVTEALRVLRLLEAKGTS